MEIERIVKQTSDELDAWMDATGCDHVSRAKISLDVLLKNYHNALVDDLAEQGVQVEKVDVKLLAANI